MISYKRPQQVKNLIRSFKNGATIQVACKAADITPVTYWRWMNKKPKFRSMVLEAMESRTGMVVDALFNKAIEGNVEAQKFFLKNRACQDWQDKQTHEVTEKIEEKKIYIIHNTAGDADYKKATGDDPAESRINEELPKDDKVFQGGDVNCP